MPIFLLFNDIYIETINMIKRKPIKWNKKACEDAAKMCESKSEFNKKYPGAYKESKLCGWFEEITSGYTLVGCRYKRCIYAYEFPDNSVYVGLTCNLNKRNIQHHCKTDSAVYKYIEKTKQEPKLKQITEYVDYLEASKKEGEVLIEYLNNGWNILNRRDTGGLGSSLGRKEKVYKRNINGYWTKEKCKEEALKYKHRSEFMNLSPTAYSISCRMGWLDDICSHMEYINRQVWTKDEAKKEALKYKHKKDFMNGSNGCYQVCLKRGWLDEVASHMESLIDKRRIYNSDNVKEEVAKHQSMSELKKSNNNFTRGCYYWIKKKKLFEEYKKFLIKSKTNGKGIIWTEDIIRAKYKEYKSYKDFRESSKIYQAAKNRSMLLEIKEYFNEKRRF